MDTITINEMTANEAQKWELKVAGTVHDLRTLLADGYERKVWIALGYLTWTECLRALSEKYGFSERRAWQLHSANLSDKLLNHGSVVCQTSERQLRPLSGLEPEQQREAWTMAIETAPEKGITAKHVQSVVETFSNNGNGTGEVAQEVSDYLLEKWDDSNLRFDPEKQTAYCKYCYTIHDHWYLSEDHADPMCWKCLICEHFSADDLLEITNKVKPHVANNSGENEWYTPPEYIAAAVAVMGRIDIDPASSDKANETVKASRYHTKEDDGLSQVWAGKVWMNPPYTLELIRQFVSKYVEYVTDGYISEGVVLVNNATETNWFMELVNVSDAVVFTKGRVRFLDPQGNPGAPLQGQAIIYSGKNPDGFLSEFLQFGWGARL